MSCESPAKSDDNIEIWQKMWQKMGDRVPWQVTGPHRGLVKNIKALTNGKQHQSILVPLCGATDDLLWLADQGHTVVGIEAAREAIKMFFEKNKLEYEMSAINLAPSGAYIFKAKDKNVTIVEADFWHFQQSIFGAFDAVWDRAALIAVLNAMCGGKGNETGEKYLKVLRDVLKPHGRVLLETWLFDPAKYDPTKKCAESCHGPKPYLLTDEDLKAICGSNWDMKRVDIITVEANEQFMEWVFPYKIDMCYTVLTPKEL